MRGKFGDEAAGDDGAGAVRDGWAVGDVDDGDFAGAAHVGHGGAQHLADFEAILLDPIGGTQKFQIDFDADGMLVTKVDAPPRGLVRFGDDPGGGAL